MGLDAGVPLKRRGEGGVLRSVAASTRPPVLCYRNAGSLARNRKDKMPSTMRHQCSSMLRVAKGICFCAAAVTESVPNTPFNAIFAPDFLRTGPQSTSR